MADISSIRHATWSFRLCIILSCARTKSFSSLCDACKSEQHWHADDDLASGAGSGCSLLCCVRAISILDRALGPFACPSSVAPCVHTQELQGTCQVRTAGVRRGFKSHTRGRWRFSRKVCVAVCKTPWVLATACFRRWGLGLALRNTRRFFFIPSSCARP